MSVLSETDLNRITDAIAEAENHSSGEIRVHIDNNTETENAKKAWEVFQALNMTATRERNGVLFHVNFEKKYLTIIGDEGIHRHVKQSFWDSIHDEMTAAFQKGLFCEGLIHGIYRTGQELKKHFPIIGDNPNELSNEISFS